MPDKSLHAKSNRDCFLILMGVFTVLLTIMAVACHFDRGTILFDAFGTTLKHEYATIIIKQVYKSEPELPESEWWKQATAALKTRPGRVSDTTFPRVGFSSGNYSGHGYRKEFITPQHYWLLWFPVWVMPGFTALLFTLVFFRVIPLRKQPAPPKVEKNPVQPVV